MKILFLFDSHESAVTVSRLYQHLNIKALNIGDTIESVNIEKRRLWKLLQKAREADNLPKYVYCSRKFLDELDTLKSYPECIVRIYDPFKEFFSVDSSVQADIEEFTGKRNVYIVPSNRYTWMGEIVEGTVSIFEEPSEPNFDTLEEAEKYALYALENKRVLLLQSIERHKKQILDDEKKAEKMKTLIESKKKNAKLKNMTDKERLSKEQKMLQETKGRRRGKK